MSQPGLIDHLFRHEYGKLMAVLTRIFGLHHLEMVEDAVQDTFARALLAWRTQIPDQPEAWLMRAARNRAIDLIRQVNAQNKHTEAAQFEVHPQELARVFLDSEIQDSQLRMIFAACHPVLQPHDQLAFALKTISGFSQKEIAAALLLKEDTVKKRLQRARKSVAEQGISFEVPQGDALQARLNQVLEVIHLIFNEGFHSTRQDFVIREELCGEALRLARMVLERKDLRCGEGYALLSLLCFHSARLKSKVDEEGELISLRNQDRTQWYAPLVDWGNNALAASFSYEDSGPFRLEAAIAAEHHKAPSYTATNWPAICALSEELIALHPSPMTWLNLAMVHLEAGNTQRTSAILERLQPESFEQRRYLFHGAAAELAAALGQTKSAVEQYDLALRYVRNSSEKAFLESRKASLLSTR